MTVGYDDVVKIIENAGTRIDFKKLSSKADLAGIGADSLDMMNIILGIQELSGIVIRDEDIESLTSVDAIVKYLDGK